MNIKKLLLWLGGILACICVILAVLIGSFIYKTRYKITEIDTSTSPDGRYELHFQAVGEPDFPFGYSHARFELKDSGKTITILLFDVANDGAILFPDNWEVVWEDTDVKATVHGEEQEDREYLLPFDGEV